jgi:23S rRNA (adenine2503-C2)-methyltransferase
VVRVRHSRLMPGLTDFDVVQNHFSYDDLGPSIFKTHDWQTRFEMQAIFDLTRNDAAEICRRIGRSTVHADQLFRLIYKQLNVTAQTDPSLPEDFRTALQEFATPNQCASIAEVVRSRYDYAAKFRIRLSDGLEVETVLMPEEDRLTICVSSQVGCRQGCRFCQTGRMGLVRNLTAGEIIAQLFIANQWADSVQLSTELAAMRVPNRITNVVFMGMGEPLDNLDEVIRSLTIMRDHFGFQLSLKRLSVSTAGHLDGIEKILNIEPNLSLALSLHSPDEQERSRLMPINRKWPIHTVLETLKKYQSQRKSDFLIQYTLLAGTNDSAEHAHQLAALLGDLKVKINLIPFNPFDDVIYRPPTPEAIQQFRDILHSYGFRVLVRYSKGQDIKAACGQLIKKQKIQKTTLTANIASINT